MASSMNKELQTLHSIFSLLPTDQEIEFFPTVSNIFKTNKICSKEQLHELFFRLDLLWFKNNNSVMVKRHFESLQKMIVFNIVLREKYLRLSAKRVRQYSIIIPSNCNSDDHQSRKKRNEQESSDATTFNIDIEFMQQLTTSYNQRISINMNTTGDFNNNDNRASSPPNVTRQPKYRLGEKFIFLKNKFFKLPVNYQAISTRKLYELRRKSDAHDLFIQENDSLKATLKHLEDQLNFYKTKSTQYQHQMSSSAEETLGKLLIEKSTSRCLRMQDSCDMDLSWYLYSDAWALIPKVSSDGLSQSIPVIISAWLASLGICDFMRKNPNFIKAVASMCPSPGSLHNHIQIGKERFFLQLASIVSMKIPLTILHDKGERAGLGRLVKEFAYWNNSNKCVQLVRGCADGSDSTDEAVAASINITMSNIDDYLESTKARLHGATTDSGGGGTTDSVMNVLRNKYDRCDASICYVNNCCMHALNRAFQVAFEDTFGKGGLGEKNVLQFLHTCWSIQDGLGEQFSYAWDFFSENNSDHNGINLAKIKKPLLTRWGYVLDAATGVFENFERWNFFLEKIYSVIDKKEMTMARFCCQLMNQPKLKSDLAFITCFGATFYNHHFAWLHRTDEKTKTTGFSSHEMAIRVAIMSYDLEHLSKNWKSSPKFKACTDILKDLQPDKKKKDQSIISAGKETSTRQYDVFL